MDKTWKNQWKMLQAHFFIFFQVPFHSFGRTTLYLLATFWKTSWGWLLKELPRALEIRKNIALVTSAADLSAQLFQQTPVLYDQTNSSSAGMAMLQWRGSSSPVASQNSQRMCRRTRGLAQDVGGLRHDAGGGQHVRGNVFLVVENKDWSKMPPPTTTKCDIM